MKKRQIAVLLGLLAGAVCSAGAQSSGATQDNGSKKEADAVKTAPDEFVIGPDDVLIISVWKEPDITRTIPVRPDGKITLPLINDVQASGLTPMQLGLSITEKLRKFINEPQVTVIVQAINSRRIHIVGQVGRQGTFPMLPDMTAMQALAGAGGFSQFANTKKTYILRMEDGKQIRIPFNYNEVLKGNKQDVKLKPHDTIVVP
jgi:polysaccharide export outer membrane protein